MADDETKGNGRDEEEAPRGKKLSSKGLVGALKGDVCEILDQLGPAVIAAVQATSGGERTTITVTATYNPGGERSRARFDVTGRATIPAAGTSHVAVIEDTKDGAQLKMFEQAQPIG